MIHGLLVVDVAVTVLDTLDEVVNVIGVITLLGETGELLVLRYIVFDEDEEDDDVVVFVLVVAVVVVVVQVEVTTVDVDDNVATVVVATDDEVDVLPGALETTIVLDLMVGVAFEVCM